MKDIADVLRHRTGAAAIFRQACCRGDIASAPKIRSNILAIRDCITDTPESEFSAYTAGGGTVDSMTARSSGYAVIAHNFCRFDQRDWVREAVAEMIIRLHRSPTETHEAASRPVQ
jgi:hypothetical protein